MTAKPVAWMYKRDGGKAWASTTPPTEYGPNELSGNRISFVPLYASSPAQARALAIAEAARVGRDLYKGDGGRLNSYDEGWNDGIDAAEQAIRALSSPPSVTEKWVNERARETYNALGPHFDLSKDAVRAALAALGVEVTK